MLEGQASTCAAKMRVSPSAKQRDWCSTSKRSPALPPGPRRLRAVSQHGVGGKPVADDQMPLHRGAHLASQQVASCDGVPVFLMAMMLQLLLMQ